MSLYIKPLKSSDRSLKSSNERYIPILTIEKYNKEFNIFDFDHDRAFKYDVSNEGFKDIIKRAYDKIKEWLKKFINWITGVFNSKKVKNNMEVCKSKIAETDVKLKGKTSIDDSEMQDNLNQLVEKDEGIPIPLWYYNIDDSRVFTIASEKQMIAFNKNISNLIMGFIERYEERLIKGGGDIDHAINMLNMKIISSLHDICYHSFYSSLKGALEKLTRGKIKSETLLKKHDIKEFHANVIITSVTPNSYSYIVYGKKNEEDKFITLKFVTESIKSEDISSSYIGKAAEKLSSVYYCKQLGDRIVNDINKYEDINAILSKETTNECNRILTTLEDMEKNSENETKTMVVKLVIEIVRVMIKLIHSTVDFNLKVFNATNINKLCQFMLTSFNK